MLLVKFLRIYKIIVVCVNLLFSGRTETLDNGYGLYSNILPFKGTVQAEGSPKSTVQVKMKHNISNIFICVSMKTLVIIVSMRL